MSEVPKINIVNTDLQQALDSDPDFKNGMQNTSAAFWSMLMLSNVSSSGEMHIYINMEGCVVEIRDKDEIVAYLEVLRRP